MVLTSCFCDLALADDDVDFVLELRRRMSEEERREKTTRRPNIKLKL